VVTSILVTEVLSRAAVGLPQPGSITSIAAVAEARALPRAKHFAKHMCGPLRQQLGTKANALLT